MSVYREAQQWLEANDVYPGPGLANIRWSPRRRYLAAWTLRDQLILYRIDPPDVLLVSEPGLRVAGMVFLEEDRFVYRRYPEPSSEGAGETLDISVREEEAGLLVRTVSVETACRTFGMSLDGRFLLLGRGAKAADPAGILDLGRWDDADRGRYETGLTVISGIGLESEIGSAWIAPHGTRFVVRARASANTPRDLFLDTAPDEAPSDRLASLSRHVRASVELPQYQWASPTYVWSDDGRWIAARIQEQTPSDWDEIPVGGPDLSAHVAMYDGATGTRLWSHEVDSIFGPFEWTPDGGRLEAAARYWDPATGESLGPAPS